MMEAASARKTAASNRPRSVRTGHGSKEAQSKEAQSKEAQSKEAQSKEAQSKEARTSEVPSMSQAPRPSTRVRKSSAPPPAALEDEEPKPDPSFQDDAQVDDSRSAGPGVFPYD
jgi:hypothetical protein